MKVKVTITTEDGEVLDQFLAEDGRKRLPNAPEPTQNALANEVRGALEMIFNTEDLS